MQFVHVLREIEGWLPNYLLLRNSQEEFLKLLLSLFGGSELTLCTFDHDATNTYTSDGDGVSKSNDSGQDYTGYIHIRRYTKLH